MERIRDHILPDIIRFFQGAKIVPFKELQTAQEALAASVKKHDPEVDAVIAQLDPSFLVYMQAIEFVMVITHLISPHPSLQEVNQRLAQIQKQFLRKDRPIAILDSYFNFWKLFDFPLDASHETFGTLCLQICDTFPECPQDLKLFIQDACHSRMGLYVQTGANENVINLREIATQKTFQATCLTKYHGREGDIWFVRIFPPLGQYSIMMTTPYIIQNGSDREWMAFFKNHGVDLDTTDWEKALNDLMKWGPTETFWLNYIADHAAPGNGAERLILRGTP